MEETKKLVKKATKKVKLTKEEKRIITLTDKFNELKKEINNYYDLSKYEIVNTKDKLQDYIKECTEIGTVAIDTETTGLDIYGNKGEPLDIVGISMYNGQSKAIYIPISHIDYKIGLLCSNQLKRDIIKEELKKLFNTKIIMHNANYDIRVISRTIGVRLKCYWDTRLAAHLLNENEPHGLKVLHDKYILKQGGEQTFSDWFKGITFNEVPIELGFPYAAQDAVDTLELYEFQTKYLNNNKENRPDFIDLYKNLMEIEMPVLDVVVSMEDEGSYIDKDHLANLNSKYSDLTDKYDNQFQEMLKKYEDKILKYNGKSAKPLEFPINLRSPSQLKALFYDVLKMPIIGSKPSTGVEVINQLLENPGLKEEYRELLNILLLYRKVFKLKSSYLDSFQEMIKRDGKLHCNNYNQCGTVTGRFSSSEPNFQQIPSRGEQGKEFRNLFMADILENTYKNENGKITIPMTDEILIDNDYIWAEDINNEFSYSNREIIDNNVIFTTDIPELKTRTRYCFQGSDFSAQEPRTYAWLSQDQKMIQSYLDGKDLYCNIAALSFNRKYEECVEFFPKGSYIKQHEDGHWYYGTENDYDKIADGETDTFHEGKEYRTKAKKILLGLMYGMSVNTLAEDLHCDTKKAQVIMDSVFKQFPGTKKYEEYTHNHCKKYGWVKTLYGRKRRLLDYRLPDYSFYYYINGQRDKNTKVANHLIEYYNNKLEACNYIDYNGIKRFNFTKYNEIKNEALLKDNIEVVSNGGFISRAERQIVNSTIQGSGAEITKKAMIKIYNDPKINQFGGKIIAQIHDELLIKCPLRWLREVKEAFQYDMEHCVEDKLKLPLKCDVATTFKWYGDEIDIEKELPKYTSF